MLLNSPKLDYGSKNCSQFPVSHPLAIPVLYRNRKGTGYSVKVSGCTASLYDVTVVSVSHSALKCFRAGYSNVSVHLSKAVYFTSVIRVMDSNFQSF